jgi:uncharacterized membrane protein YtjA (UPF0391 family)
LAPSKRNHCATSRQKFGTTHANPDLQPNHPAKEVRLMLGWAVTFLIIALIAAVLGFGGIAAASAGIAKLLFVLFLVMCVIFFFLGWRGRGPAA